MPRLKISDILTKVLAIVSIHVGVCMSEQFKYIINFITQRRNPIIFPIVF